MNKDNNDRKKKEEPQDILSMIRARQEENNMDLPKNNDNRKLRELFARLKNEGTIEEDYAEHPMYKIGFEAGEEMGFEIANQRFQDELRALRTMIDAMIDSK